MPEGPGLARCPERDIISGGSPAGTNIERAEPRWMKAGDTATCAIEGIGALSHPIVNE